MNKIFLIVPCALIIFTDILFSQSFQEVSQSLGVNESYGSGVHIQGGGISLVDFNLDGWNDLTLATRNNNEILFYQNNSGTSFSRVDFLIPEFGRQKQILWVDYDNDGDLDLYISTFHGANKLYRNLGDMSFEDVTVDVGLPLDQEDSFGAIFGDVNNDGYLDLFVSNYFFYNSHLYLYQNGVYVEYTDSLLTLPDTSSLNFCAAFFDYDKDNDLDLYLINDKNYENDFYVNEGNMTFVEKSQQSNLNIIIDAMNAGIGDINNDGLLDIYVTDSPNTGNRLLKGKSDGTFEDISESAGVTFDSWCWGGSICDFDNDGFQDIYVSSMYTEIQDQNKLYLNQGDETFVILDPNIMAGDTTRAFCNSVGDFNNDGLMDIFISTEGDETYAIWRNETSNSNNYLKVFLEGSISNRNGIGSWIELYTDSLSLYRFTHCGIAYLSQESYTNHFGIAEFSMVDSLIVRWPSGLVDKLYDIPANQTISVIEGCPSCPICESDEGQLALDPITNENYQFHNIDASGNIPSGGHVLFRFNTEAVLAPEFSVEKSALLIIEQSDCIE